MFQYTYPQFEKKRLLRTEMLEQLRDWPKNFLSLAFGGYSDGILNGCGISWDNGRLSVGPGTILYRGKLYIMDTEYQTECLSQDRVRYLKVQFLAEEKENGCVKGNTRIFLDEKKPDASCEIELCRFRLQEGARLRDTHEGFEDFSTAYDTVNLIHAPYAAEGGGTLNPILMRTFAGEMMRKESDEVMDLIFSTTVLANGGRVPADCIREYLHGRTGEEPEGNAGMYRGLLDVLKSQTSGGLRRERSGQAPKSVMLL